MIAILSLIIVLVVSLVIVRVATVALTLTGVSREMARFQARSAFTGAGFTTDESERMVRHPVRRRIIMLLMLLGNAGIVTAVTSLILSFTNVDEGDSFFSSIWFRVLLLAGALAALFVLAHSRIIDRWMSTAIEWALKRWTRLEVRDYASLLHLTDDYVVSEMLVDNHDWLHDRTLRELALSHEGVLVLGIDRLGGEFIGAPRGSTRLLAGDSLLLYGRSRDIADLDARPPGAIGNRAHVDAVGRRFERERATVPADERPPAKSSTPSEDDTD